MKLTKEEIEKKYYAKFAASWVNHFYNLPRIVGETELVRAGLESGIDLHMFKRLDLLPRISSVMGFLKAIRPFRMLDIGCGRGALIWPLLEVFPDIDLSVIDIDQKHIDRINSVSTQCCPNLKGYSMDATSLAFDDNYFDCVTILEVLEHIPDWKKALLEGIRVSERHVVISFPSKEDSNEEHIHLITKKDIIDCVSSVSDTIKPIFIPNHSIFIIRK